MYGSSTDLLVRRFMQRVAKPIFIGSFCVFALLLALPWIPSFSPEWLTFIGGFYSFVVAFPVGGTAVLLVVEIGRMGRRSQWDPPSTWISFFVAISSVIATLLYYCKIIAVGSEGSDLSPVGNWMIAAAIVMLFAFLIKFYAVLARERILEKVYFLFLVIASILTFWCFLIGVIADAGNPMDAAPWRQN